MTSGAPRDEASGDDRTREETWALVAAAVGGELHTGFGRGPRVQKRSTDWILTLDQVRNESGVPHTRLRAPYRTSEPFAFEVREVRPVDGFLETLGFLQDITLGDAGLDRRFVIKGSSWAKVRGLFAEPRVREILRAQPTVHLRAFRSPSYGPPFVSGLWELHFREAGELTDVERLEALFELFGLLLPRLCPESSGWEGDLERLTDRLLGPGSRVTDPVGGLVVWDGNGPRRDAAERLGRLGDPRAVAPLVSVLDDEDDELVARAVGALAELGDPGVVGPLTRLLGRRRRETAAGSLAELAGEALARLGRDDLPRAFDQALAGHPSALRRTGHGEEVVEALQAVLDSTEFGAAAHAARALGALGAREAVPLLRSKSRGWGMRTTLTEACEAALAEIESREGLPRPARPAPRDEDRTLPRPAGPGASSQETLPRSVDGEGETS